MADTSVAWRVAREGGFFTPHVTSSLVPKLLFGNGLFRNAVSPLQGLGSETEFRTDPVPKQEFGNERR
jgi:hypothetical protein